MNSLFKAALIRLSLFLFLGFLIGYQFDQILPALFFALGLYIALFLIDYYRFLQWLDNSDFSRKPFSVGAWKAIVDRVTKTIRSIEQERDQIITDKHFFVDAFDALENAVVVVNDSGHIDWANRAAKQMIGIDLSRDQGQKLLHLYRSPIFDRYFSEGNFDTPIILSSSYDQSNKLEIQITTFLNKRLLFVRDISEAVKLDNIRTDFIANVSHELKTPLTVISGYLDLLSDHRQDLPAAWANVVENMKGQSERMDDLVEDLITLSRLETMPLELEPEKVFIDGLLRSIISQTEVINPNKQITLVVEDKELRDKRFSLLGNHKELHSVFSNILQNAIKYSADKSEITVHCYVYFQTFRVSFTDNGEGISPEHISRLTERFYRVDESRTTSTGGTGLGLAIVKHALSRHEGTLEIASTVGKGSTFTCVFPLSNLMLEAV